jgi:acetyltransferase EpsM
LTAAPKTAERLLVLGARQYAPVFADVFEGVGGFVIAGFVENLDRELCAVPILDRPVYWIDDIIQFCDDHFAICCLATNKRSGFIEQAAALGFRFATLVHPTSWVSPRTRLADGVSIDVNVTIAGFSEIGAHVRVGRGATIGHHTRIGEFSTVHPGVDIAGNCVLEPGVTVGIGATIVDGCRVGQQSFVAAGAVVVSDVPPNVLVGGVPARVLRQNYGVS